MAGVYVCVRLQRATLLQSVPLYEYCIDSIDSGVGHEQGNMVNTKRKGSLNGEFARSTVQYVPQAHFFIY